MSAIKRKLDATVRALKPAPRKSLAHSDYSALQELREAISRRLNSSVRDITKPAPFDEKHGLVYKLLKTDRRRLKDSTLCSHDTVMWLRDFRNPAAAAWMLKLAGPDVGQVSRNQVLQWLRDNGRAQDMRMLYDWTKKWGFKDSDYTKNIVLNPKTVDEARELYKTTNFAAKKSKKAFGNHLLKIVIQNGCPPKEVFGFFVTIPKDIITYQLMLAGMIELPALRVYRDQVGASLQKDIAAGNVRADDKLNQTYHRLRRLPITDPAMTKQTGVVT